MIVDIEEAMKCIAEAGSIEEKAAVVVEALEGADPLLVDKIAEIVDTKLESDSIAVKFVKALDDPEPIVSAMAALDKLMSIDQVRVLREKLELVNRALFGPYEIYGLAAGESLKSDVSLKTLDNSTIDQAKDQVSDLKVIGNGDMFQLLCKASSKAEGWLKSTKAMEIPGIGCLVQVTTQQGDQVAEALQFVPDVCVVDDSNGGRKLVRVVLCDDLEYKSNLYSHILGAIIKKHGKGLSFDVGEVETNPDLSVGIVITQKRVNKEGKHLSLCDKLDHENDRTLLSISLAGEAGGAACDSRRSE